MIISYLKRIEQIDQLIRLKATGRPEQLAEKVGIKERTIYEYIQMMRAMGAEIAYCRHAQTYYYLKCVYFKYGFKEQETL